MPLRFIPDIHRATHRIALYLAETADFDINQAEAHVLAHLAAFGDSTVADIHRAFAHKRSTLTSILDRLVSRGLITRSTAETDRRSFTVHLTAAGQRLARKVYRHLRAFEDRVLADVSADDLNAFLRVLMVAEEPQRVTVKRRRQATKQM
jgi:DNA-binding MarR family transcriptional regulator